MKKIVFTSNELEQILNLYQHEGMGMAKIGTMFNVSKTVISRVLKENGVKIKQDNHVYKADYRIFENINTPEKAYWLGFIAADGCVYDRPQNATIKITIHEKDKAHLEKFKKFLNSNIPIKETISQGFSGYASSPCVTIDVNSKKMAYDLIDKNIVPRKSLILKPPKIDEQYYLPYIMGYFDGDGSIYKTGKNHLEFGIEFIGSLETISWINQVLNLNAKLEKRNVDKETYHIRCGGIQKPYSIIKPIFNSVDIHLDRKYLLFQELENVVLNRNIK